MAKDMKCMLKRREEEVINVLLFMRDFEMRYKSPMNVNNIKGKDLVQYLADPSVRECLLGMLSYLEDYMDERRKRLLITTKSSKKQSFL